MIFLRAFLVGGAICAIGQLLMDLTTLTPAHIMVILVVAGAVLAGMGLYDPLVKFAGAGATVPITNFGNSLAKGAMAEADEHGLVGVLMGIFSLTSAGISSAIIFGFFTSILANPKG